MGDVWITASNYADTLDRSALGGFAISDDAFVMADYIHRLTTNSQNIDNYKTLYVHGMRNKLDRYIAAEGTTALNVNAELSLWKGELCGSHSSSDLGARLMQLQMIAAHPEYHDYFAAGIWDLTTIGQLAADDIDPRLAVEVL